MGTSWAPATVTRTVNVSEVRKRSNARKGPIRNCGVVEDKRLWTGFQHRWARVSTDAHPWDFPNIAYVYLRHSTLLTKFVSRIPPVAAHHPQRRRNERLIASSACGNHGSCCSTRVLDGLNRVPFHQVGCSCRRLSRGKSFRYCRRIVQGIPFAIYTVPSLRHTRLLICNAGDMSQSSDLSQVGGE